MSMSVTEDKMFAIENNRDENENGIGLLAIDEIKSGKIVFTAENSQWDKGFLEELGYSFEVGMEERL